MSRKARAMAKPADAIIYCASVQLFPVCVRRSWSKAGLGMKRLATLSPRFWRWAKMRFNCAAAAMSVERLCRSRSSSSRRVNCLPADGPAKAAITSNAVPRTPASIRIIVKPGISPPSPHRPARRRSGRRRRRLGLLSDERLEAAELAEQRAAAGLARLVLPVGRALLHGQREQLVQGL